MSQLFIFSISSSSFKKLFIARPRLNMKFSFGGSLGVGLGGVGWPTSFSNTFVLIALDNRIVFYSSFPC